MAAPRHQFRTHIRATPEQVWQALTDPAFTTRYFHRTAVDSTFEPGAPLRYVLPDGTDAVVGEVVEVDPPRRLVITWSVRYDEAAAAEPTSRVEWLIEPGSDGITTLTTVHRDLARSPVTSDSVGEGWTFVLDSLKSLLETGTALEGRPAPPRETEAGGDEADAELHRRLAVDANNSTWELLERDDRSPGDADDLLERAYAAAYHWRRAARREPANAARAAWLVSRAHAVLGNGDVALYHAKRCAHLVATAGLADFDLAYAHEAKARALACLGRWEEAAVERKAAGAVPIADEDDRAVFESDLAAEPWFGL